MIQLLDARSDSLTVTWPVVENAKRYVLELKVGRDGIYNELSSKLTQPQAKKKNLQPNQEYWFRVAAVVDDDVVGGWITHTHPFPTLEEDATFLEAPTVTLGGNEALTISWKSDNNNNSNKYELQMRENRGGQGWTTIAPSLSNTQVKKKNLTSQLGYQFRVCAVVAGDSNNNNSNNNNTNQAFSPPSTAMVARGLSENLKRQWFSGVTSLLKNNSPAIPLNDALGGKEFVLFYVSAHWCPPCRKFTPMLANWYNQSNNKQYVEVVFVSADHDEQGFENYFKQSHPWTAIDYENDAREQIMAKLRVQGIPRLVVVDAVSGQIVENNAVGKPLDLNTWRRSKR